MSIRETEDMHIQRLKALDELGQFDYLVDLGVELGRDGEIETSENRIKGCMTAIWIKSEDKQTRLSSDSLVVLGLLSILKQMYEKRSSKEIASNPIRFLDVISEHVVYPEIRKNGIKKVYGILSGSKEDQG